jgi:hypothetical protein
VITTNLSGFHHCTVYFTKLATCIYVYFKFSIMFLDLQSTNEEEGEAKEQNQKLLTQESC